MEIDSIRIYAEVLEQGIDFKEYLQSIGVTSPVNNVYSKKARGEITAQDSLVSRIRKSKDVDVLLTVVSNNREFPLLMVEYSTAVPTDDHKMQRFDVCYWGSVYKTPVMKIYPHNKGMTKSFGGANKITDDVEIFIAKQHRAVFYPIQWHTVPNSDVLETKPNALSCIPRSGDIEAILSQLIHCFTTNATIDAFYDDLLLKYEQKYLAALQQCRVNKQHLLSSSKRFYWDADNLTVKINRLGHAMDPERGVLFFVNMLIGAENTATEIQINRSSNFYARGGYASLFDALSKENELGNCVRDLIQTQNNAFTPENAVHILSAALNLPPSLFSRVSSSEYEIDDDRLYEFLIKHPSLSAKSIFLLSTKLILTDQRRQAICVIAWHAEPIGRYLDTLYVTNYTPLEIRTLNHSAAKEDIISYASAELYKKMRCELLAVSYPGAQGDRCILSGAGRKALRTYVDIIAYRENAGTVTVYLEECKDKIGKSAADAQKLNALINDAEKLRGLSNLYYKVTGFRALLSLSTGIGAKYAAAPPVLNVDYIFMFSVDDSRADKTIVHYNVAVVNTKMLKDFEALADADGRLIGSLAFDKIYTIKQ